jgi:hypothetical protein
LVRSLRSYTRLIGFLWSYTRLIWLLWGYTGLIWPLSCDTWLIWPLCCDTWLIWFLWSYTRLIRFLRSDTWLIWSLRGYTGLIWLLWSYTGLIWLLWGYTGPIWLLWSYTWLIWFLRSDTWLIWSLRSYTGLIWLLWSYTGLIWFLGRYILINSAARPRCRGPRRQILPACRRSRSESGRRRRSVSGTGGWPESSRRRRSVRGTGGWPESSRRRRSVGGRRGSGSCGTRWDVFRRRGPRHELLIDTRRFERSRFRSGGTNRGQVGGPLEGRGESDVVAELGVAVIHGAGEDGIGAARGVADGLGGARAGVVSVLSSEDDVRLDVQGLDVDESGTEPGPSGELDGRLRHRALPSRDLVQVVDLAANFLVLAAVAHITPDLQQSFAVLVDHSVDTRAPLDAGEAHPFAFGGVVQRVLGSERFFLLVEGMCGGESWLLGEGLRRLHPQESVLALDDGRAVPGAHHRPAQERVLADVDLGPSVVVVGVAAVGVEATAEERVLLHVYGDGGLGAERLGGGRVGVDRCQAVAFAVALFVVVVGGFEGGVGVHPPVAVRGVGGEVVDGVGGD